MGGRSDISEIVPEIKIWSYNLWYMHKLESVQENETHKILWGFRIH